MAVEFKLDPRDQQKFGGPEWVTLDAEVFNDLPWSVSGPWDRELVKVTGEGISRQLVAGLIDQTADGVTALVWLARKVADIPTPELAKFDILWRRVDRRAVVELGDVDPPSAGSSEPHSETGQ